MAATGSYGGFDPSSYHFVDSDLATIIKQTAEALSEMATVNNLVMSHTDSLVEANQSDSGSILSQHLGTWTADFNKCTNNLRDINGKATMLLSANRGTGNNATDLARNSGGAGGSPIPQIPSGP
jgi:hypothetical protein